MAILRTLLQSSVTIPVSEKGALWRNVRTGMTPRDLARSHRVVLKQDPLLLLEALQFHFLLDEHYLLLEVEDKRLRNLEVDAKAKGTRKRCGRFVGGVYWGLQQKVEFLRGQGLSWGKLYYKLNLGRANATFVFPLVRELVTLDECVSARRLALEKLPRDAGLQRALCIEVLNCLGKSKPT